MKTTKLLPVKCSQNNKGNNICSTGIRKKHVEEMMCQEEGLTILYGGISLQGWGCVLSMASSEMCNC